MQFDKTGTVLVPEKYQGWKAELTGDDNDTGGICALLLSPTKQDRLLLWEPTAHEIEEDFRAQGIVVDWDDNKLIEAFLSPSNLSKKSAKDILSGLYDPSIEEKIFNLTQLQFLFDKQRVVLSYYVVDEKYADLTFSFLQLENLLTDYLRK